MRRQRNAEGWGGARYIVACTPATEPTGVCCSTVSPLSLWTSPERQDHARSLQRHSTMPPKPQNPKTPKPLGAFGLTQVLILEIKAQNTNDNELTDIFKDDR